MWPASCRYAAVLQALRAAAPSGMPNPCMRCCSCLVALAGLSLPTTSCHFVPASNSCTVSYCCSTKSLLPVLLLLCRRAPAIYSVLLSGRTSVNPLKAVL
jgi:hypothetical protein